MEDSQLRELLHVTNYSDMYGTYSGQPVGAAQHQMDFTQWEVSHPQQAVVTNLGLSSDEITAIRNNQYGFSEVLLQHFEPVFKYRNGKLKNVIKTSIAFEKLGRDALLVDIAAAISTPGKPINTAAVKGFMRYVRDNYQTAFDVTVIIEGEKAHLVSVDEVGERTRRLLAQFEKTLLPNVTRLSKEINSLKRCGTDYQLDYRTQALLLATKDDEEIVGAVQQLIGE